LKRGIKVQNLLQLLQDLKVPASKPKIIIVPRNERTVEELSYQLQLELDIRNVNK
jgi:hypothetical protein